MMADGQASGFTMYGARDAIAGGLAHIDEQVKAIERAVIENPGLAFDLARTLVESVCRSVLSERSIPYSENDDLPKLFKTAAQILPFLPREASAEAEIRRSLTQTLNGLHTTVQGICELRNQCGFASHGKGKPSPEMEPVQALLAAQAADTIVGFLHRVHCRDRIPSPNPQIDFDANDRFNAYVDDAFGTIRIFEAEFRPSQVLFELEPETYRVYLNEFEVDAQSDETGEPSNSLTEVTA